MTKRFSDIHFTSTKTVITYDLSPCKISVYDICNQDKRLNNTISVNNSGTFDLPNTTIVTELSISDAITAFRNAVIQADSNEKITRLFAAEVYDKSGYVENNN